jgi:TetR/AcrR family transcriptional repressor of nem operon
MSKTREYIIDQAYSLFLSRSYEAVSISDISKAIGFTKGALYHHFTNKEELFKAVIDKYLLISELDVSNSNVTLEMLIEEIIKKARDTMNCIFGQNPTFIPINFLALFIDAYRHYPGFSSDKLNYSTNEVNKIKSVLDYAIERGEIRSDINSSLMATNFFALKISLTHNLLHNNSPELAIELLRNQLNELYKIIKT